MTPPWFPWIIVGGFIFVVLGFVGTKYKDKEYHRIQSLQDFISGSILIAFTGVLVPDLFPPFELLSSLSFPLSSSVSMSGAGESSDEVDLQVGPPRLFRS